MADDLARAEDPTLVTRDVIKDFGEGENRTRVLHGVSISVSPGELVALMGPSGSGKSTLLNIVGLLDRPTSGSVVLSGVETTTLDDAGLTLFRGEKLGFVFQFHHLLPAFTALENVLLPTWGLRGRPPRDMETRAKDLLAEVGLKDRMHYRSTALSGGQAQRVAVARALVHQPRLVLADEPTGNLDTESSREVFDLMRRLNRDLGTAFLVVTHDPRIAERCDRLVDMVDGRIA
ncbi:MAG: ABC transporter ATP-binding protein [Polyangiaceae bacterium]